MGIAREPKFNIALVGLGAIGSSLYAYALEKRSAWKVAVYDKEKEVLEGVADEARLAKADLLHTAFDLVVESASREAVVELLPELLMRSSVVTLSLSAFADQIFFNKIVEMSKQSGKKVYIPEGALIGSEAILTFKNLLNDVRLTTRKSPEALGLPKEKEGVLFEGSARQACFAFPRNLNVAATLSLYGIGFDQTKVKLVADASLSANIHCIDARGGGSRFLLEVSSTPSLQNLRSSSSILHSLVRALDRFSGGGLLPDLATLAHETDSSF